MQQSRVSVLLAGIFGACLVSHGASAQQQAAHFDVLHTFPEEVHPSGGLLQLNKGPFLGGTSAEIFAISPAGVYTTVHTFNPSPHQGFSPAMMMQASDGLVYGGNLYGGDSGFGTLFKISLDGTYTVLHEFTSIDGSSPNGPLVEAFDGNLYGTTQYGGSGNAGTIFRLTRDGVFTSLYSFNRSYGYVNGGLALYDDGTLWGTTFAGGAAFPAGTGTVFKSTTDGSVTTVYQFDGINGYEPEGTVTLASDHNFYGTTAFGGSLDFGAVYRLTPDGDFSVVASFDDNSNGSVPSGNLVEGSDGALYGSTGLEYYYLGGTVFRCTKAGVLNTLHAFGEGDQPVGNLQAAGGGIRGVSYDLAYVIRDALPEPKPYIARLIPSGGKPGDPILISGDHFVYSSVVTFNGVPAAFETVSHNFIRVLVPQGATTGPVSVTNIGGTSVSEQMFTLTD